MKRENFYRRDPSKALSGMIGLSLEERGVYNTIIDLLYSTWLPLEDDRAFIAGWCGCAVQKVGPIIRRLIEKERLITFTEGGRTYLSDAEFEVERKAVKGSTKTRSGRAQVGEKSAGVSEKSAGVEEKSAGVGQNPRLLDPSSEENQSLTALEKNREDKSRDSKEANASSLSARAGANGVREIAEAVWAVWPDDGRKCSSLRELVSAIEAELSLGADPDRLIAAARAYAADKGRSASGRAKAVAEWFRSGRWEHFAPTAQGLGGGAADLFRFDGPDEVRSLLLAEQGEDFVRSYLDPARYDPGGRRIHPRTGSARSKLAEAWAPLKAQGYVLGEVQKGAA